MSSSAGQSSKSDFGLKDPEAGGLLKGEFEFLTPAKLAQLGSRYTQLGHKYVFHFLMGAIGIELQLKE